MSVIHYLPSDDIRKMSKKAQRELVAEESKLEGLNHQLSGLQLRLMTAKGTEKESIYADIRKFEAWRFNVSEHVDTLNSYIAEIRAELAMRGEQE